MKFLCCQQLRNKWTSTPNKPTSIPKQSNFQGGNVCTQPETEIQYCHYCRLCLCNSGLFVTVKICRKSLQLSVELWGCTLEGGLDSLFINTHQKPGKFQEVDAVFWLKEQNMRGRKALCTWTASFDCSFCQSLPILREGKIQICKGLHCPSTEKNFNEPKSTSLLLKKKISGFKGVSFPLGSTGVDKMHFVCEVTVRSQLHKAVTTPPPTRARGCEIGKELKSAWEMNRYWLCNLIFQYSNLWRGENTALLNPSVNILY